MRWTKKGHEFDDLAGLIRDDSIRYYVWGDGVLGKRFYHEFKDKIRIIGYVDSDTSKQGISEDGYTVISPNDLILNKNEMVLIATGWIAEISEVLVGKGYKPNQDFMHIDYFTPIFMFYRHQKVCLEKIDLDINTLCTLRCKHCASFIPYIRHGVNDELEAVKRSIDALFKWVDYVHVIGIGGGDAMLHPKLRDVIDYFALNYSDKYGDLELYTNAIVMPSPEMLDTWKKHKVIVRFTDYSKSVGNKQKINDMVQTLKNNDIGFDHVRFDHWVDLGYPQESNGINTEEKLINHCNTCSPVICSGLSDEKVFYCAPMMSAFRSGLFHVEQSDYFDLKQKCNDQSRKEFIEYYLGYSEKGYLSHCRRCNGLFNNNRNYIEVGEQLV